MMSSQMILIFDVYLLMRIIQHKSQIVLTQGRNEKYKLAVPILVKTRTNNVLCKEGM